MILKKAIEKAKNEHDDMVDSIVINSDNYVQQKNKTQTNKLSNVQNKNKQKINSKSISHEFNIDAPPPKYSKSMEVSLNPKILEQNNTDGIQLWSQVFFPVRAKL